MGTGVGLRIAAAQRAGGIGRLQRLRIDRRMQHGRIGNRSQAEPGAREVQVRQHPFALMRRQARIVEQAFAHVAAFVVTAQPVSGDGELVVDHPFLPVGLGMQATRRTIKLRRRTGEQVGERPASALFAIVACQFAQCLGPLRPHVEGTQQPVGDFGCRTAQGRGQPGRLQQGDEDFVVDGRHRGTRIVGGERGLRLARHLECPRAAERLCRIHFATPARRRRRSGTGGRFRGCRRSTRRSCG
jgi:hypothetical protein